MDLRLDHGQILHAPGVVGSSVTVPRGGLWQGSEIGTVDNMFDLCSNSDNHVQHISSYSIYIYTYIMIIRNHIPVVPHKAVAEVSKIGNYRRGELL